MAFDYDIWAQAANTALVQAATQTAIELQPRPARELSSLVPTTEDKLSLSTAEIKAFGKGRFKAFGASSPVYVPKIRYTDTEIELVQLSEQSPIDERELRKLESQDAGIRRRAGADMVLRAQALQIRNENQSDWMVMTAILTGQLPINFEDEPGQGFVIDYGYTTEQKMSVDNAWSNPATGTPIADMRAMQKQVANQCGAYGIDFWMNTDTYQGILDSDEATELLTGTDRGQRIATIDDIKQRLYEPEQVTFHITDAGYRDESAGYERLIDAHTRWFPTNVVLCTAGNVFEGRPLVEQFDGMVLVRTDFKSRELRQGAQTQYKMDDSDTLSVYQTSTRMPRINKTEAIVVADVSGS
jgi:hypothetical protein